MKRQDVEELLELLDDLNLTNDMIKEHLTILSLDKKVVDQLSSISSGAKAAFTRAYNKTHQAIVRRGKGKKAADDSEGDSVGQSDNDDAGGRLLDEDELEEIKKAKKAEKDQKKAERAMKRLEQFSSITREEATTTGKKKAPAKKGATKRAAPANKKKGRRKDESDLNEELASDDSLNDFIVGDDEVEYVHKKKRGGR